jgi:cardiolipin synthase C
MRFFFLLLCLSFFPAQTRAGDPAKVVFLDDVKAATQARIDLIANAKTEIQISTHVLSEDLAGNRLFAELVKASRRGVRVSLLYDAWENKKNISPAMIQALEANGIHVHQFRPLKMGYFWNVNRRLHDKLFIVDRQHLIQGDRNMNQNYFSLVKQETTSNIFGTQTTKTSAAFVSKEFYFEGKVASDASNYFDKLLEEGAVERMGYKGKMTPEIDAKMKLLDQYTKKNLNNILDGGQDWRKGVEAVGEVAFFHDQVKLKGSAPGSEAPLLDMIRNAKKRIYIENPYIVLTPEFKEALKIASDNKVPITVITNSPMANDMALVGAAWEESREYLRQLGATIYEHPGASPKSEYSKWNIKNQIKSQIKDQVGQFKDAFDGSHRIEGAIHNKMLIVDDEVAVKSFNLDPRSQKHNMEVVVRIKSDKMVNQVKALMIEDISERGYIQTVRKGHTVGTVPSRCGHQKVLSVMLRYFL